MDRCGDCQLDEFERARSRPELGGLLNRIIELDFLTQKFRVGLEEVTAEEARGLMVLEEERRRLSAEKMAADERR